MQVGRIQGATRVLGKSQGYKGLPIRDEITRDGVLTMTSAWWPTPKELEALNAGASLYITLLGQHHPPISIYVGQPVSEEV